MSSELEQLEKRCAALQAIAVTHCALVNLSGQAAAQRWVQHEHPLDWSHFVAPTVDRPERVGYSRYWKFAIDRHAVWHAGTYHKTFEVVPHAGYGKPR